MITRPMLAETLEDVDSIKYPVYVSAKLDGIRCIMVDSKALSRKFKPIPNHYVRNWLELNIPDGVDGELLIKGANFNQIQSGIMSEEGEPDFEFHAFDWVDSLNLKMPFHERYLALETLVSAMYDPKFKLVTHIKADSTKQLLAMESLLLDQGYEGLMVRHIDGPYKCGRSTLKEAYLLKLKRFMDSEALVLGMTELHTNTNAKETNELGLSKRSSKKEGKIGANTLGRFQVRDLLSGVEFEIGTGEGLTQVLRKEIWDNKDQYIGKIVKYKYQPAGQKNLPRFPVWLGFRDERDM